MFGVFLQRQATSDWLQGAMFNSLNVIPIKAFKNLYTTMGDNMIRAIGLPRIHYWQPVY